MKKLPIITSLVLAAASATSSVAQLRVTSWNVTNYGTDTSRDGAFRTSIYGVVPAGLALAGRSMSPDVFVGQEFTSATGVTNFRTLLNNAPGSPGDWQAAPFVNGADTDSAFFYRTSKVTYIRTVIVAVGSSSVSNQPRNTYRYDFRPVGYAANGASIGVYSVHLKAQGSDAAPPGDNSAGRRLIECQRIRDNAQGIDTNGPGTALPAGYHFMLAGDLNITASTDTEYQELVASQANNLGRLFDPINTPGSWNNNGNFRLVHTQEQTGNMDDRFDQILVSAGLIDSAGLDYVGNSAVAYRTMTIPPFGTAPFDNTRWNDPNHSFRAWGNDGTTYNAGIATTQTTNNGVAVNRQNGMVGAVIAQALIDSAAGNGHLPVLADVRVPPKVQTVASINFGQVTLGSTAQQTLTISNGGDVSKWTAAGISVLRYTLSMPSEFTSPAPGTPPAAPTAPPYWPSNPAGSFYHYAGNAANTHTVTMNTSTLGVKSGIITINAASATESPTVQVMVTGEVVPVQNQPPVANAGVDQALNDCDGSGDAPVTLNGSASQDSDGSITNYLWTEGAATLAQGPGSTANITLPTGVHTITLTVTDNQSAMTTDTVVIDVNARPTAAAGPDQVVTDGDQNGLEAVTLNGAGSDDGDGSIVSFTWRESLATIATGASPTVSLSPGVHTIELTVTDDDGCAATDSVVVRVNRPPTASAGPDQVVTDSDDTGDEAVQLDGSASGDADGTIATAIWQEFGNTFATGLTPPAVLTVGAHTFTLIITDNDGATSTDTVEITVNPAPPPACAVDFNGDGVLSPDDLDEFITTYFSEPPDNVGADFNGDGLVSPDDLDEFITAYFEGC